MSITSRIPDALNLTRVADIVGLSVRTLYRAKFRKRVPIERDPLTNLPFVRRGALLQYMAENGYPDQVMRKLMTRQFSPVLSLGVPTGVRTRWKGVRLTPVGGPICLGRRLVATPPKAVVIGVEWLPPGMGEKWAEELRRLDDDPVVFALSSFVPPGGLFDQVIPPTVSAGEMRQLLAAVPDPRAKRKDVTK